MKIKPYIISADTVLTFILVVVLLFILPEKINTNLAKDIYSVGISVISIIFSVFFAAFAIIISSGDNDFIIFLEKKNRYSIIITAFKFTLTSLFVALIVSISFYIIAAMGLSNQCAYQSKYWIITYSAFFSYSLIAAFQSSIESIRYANRRIKFVEANTKNN